MLFVHAKASLEKKKASGVSYANHPEVWIRQKQIEIILMRSVSKIRTPQIYKMDFSLSLRPELPKSNRIDEVWQVENKIKNRRFPSNRSGNFKGFILYFVHDAAARLLDNAR